MSQVTRISPTFFLLLLSISLFVLAGCGSANPQSNFDPDTGQHPAGWLPAGHMAAATTNMAACAECHGADYQGGIAQTACTECHMGNQNSYHPTQWGTYAYALHGTYAKANGTATCANGNCHGEYLGGVENSGPSCTSCHLGGPASVHPVAWSTDITLHGKYIMDNGTVSCSNSACHGVDLHGVFYAGPTCELCH